MKKIVVASTRSNAGKTSIIAGIISLVNDKKFAYAKPLGDRLIYRKKRSWDYDASLMVNILQRRGELETHYEKITLGFDHSRLKYMYDQEGIKQALSEIVTDVGGDNDVLFIECGNDLASGAYLNLDPVSIARSIGGKLVIVLSGNSDSVLDDIKFIKTYIKTDDIDFGGVIINKTSDVVEFETACMPSIAEMDIDIVGVVPYEAFLTYFTIEFLAERLLAKVLAGEDHLRKVVKKITIESPSTPAQEKQPLSTKPDLREGDHLTIVAGDKSDIILSALEQDPAGIILTSDIVPHQNIISRAEERGIPILLVGTDTFTTAKMIDEMEPLLKKDDREKLDILARLMEKHVHVADLLK